MSNEKIQELLSELRTEIDSSELDETTRTRLKLLDEELDQLLSDDSDQGDISLVRQKAEELEVDFAVRHPVLENSIREIIDVLAKMGL